MSVPGRQNIPADKAAHFLMNSRFAVKAFAFHLLKFEIFTNKKKLAFISCCCIQKPAKISIGRINSELLIPRRAEPTLLRKR